MEEPETRLVATAAHELGRDPLEALGFPAVPMRPELAALVLAMLRPELGAKWYEERQLARWKEQMEAQDAWERALPGGAGYRGPRGVAWTKG